MAALGTGHRTRATSRRGRAAARGERGAILVQTAAMLLGLTAFSAFVVDYGILWTARRQIQNAADAAALAAAISLGFDVPGDQGRAIQNATIAVAQNPVWGLPATMQPTDVTFPACPVGSVGSGSGVCVRVQAFRNQQTPGTPLPTIFALLANVANQGVRATATAQVLFGAATDCVRPFAIPDRWQELRGDVGPVGWDPLDTFDRWVPGGGALLPPPLDFYEPPSGPGANGTGFSRRPSAWSVSGDYGRPMRFAPAPLGPAAVAGNEEFLPLNVTVGGTYGTDIATCSPRTIAPGTTIEVTDSPTVATVTGPGVLALRDADPAAVWNASMNGGLGGVSGGCMAAGTCSPNPRISPRIIALPVFNPDRWDARPSGADLVEVSRIVGFFIEDYQAPYIVGRLMIYPVVPRSTMTADPESAFVVSVTLVR